MRRQHLDNTTSFVFPKRVILKRENSGQVSGKVDSHVQKWQAPPLESVSKRSTTSPPLKPSTSIKMDK